jgi:hypothetical protein
MRITLRLKSMKFDADYFEKLPHESTDEISKVWYFPKSGEAYAVKDFEKSAMAYYMDVLAPGESVEVSTNILNDFVRKTGAIGIGNSEKVTTVYSDLPRGEVVKRLKPLASRYPSLIMKDAYLEVVNPED